MKIPLIISFELVAFSVAICLQISDLFCLVDFTELDRRHNDDFDLSGELDLDESSDESDDDDPDDESEEDEDDLEELDEDEDELEGDLQDCLRVKSLPLALLDGGPNIAIFLFISVLSLNFHFIEVFELVTYLSSIDQPM